MAAAVATPTFHDLWRPRANPWAIAITVTLATFMEALDSSIANVAMQHIAGTLSASQDEATWVLTSYLVANAMVLPISGWIANRIGRKRFYMSCVFLFTVCSLLCGLAPTLGLLVFFRVLQGAAGVSIPGRCFTKQTGDMVYTMAENSWLSQLWLDA